MRQPHDPSYAAGDMPALILGTLPQCGGCMMVKRFLHTHQIPFTEIDLSQPHNKPWIDKLDTAGLTRAAPVIYDPDTLTPLLSGAAATTGVRSLPSITPMLAQSKKVRR